MTACSSPTSIASSSPIPRFPRCSPGRRRTSPGAPGPRWFSRRTTWRSAKASAQPCAPAPAPSAPSASGCATASATARFRCVSGGCGIAAWHVLGAVRDVTDSRRGEAALRDYAWRLRELSRQIIAVQEEERRRLARELHDEIGQLLTILRLQLEKLRAGGVRDDNLEGAVQSVTLLTQQVRSMSLDLRPSMLDDLGLVPTLRWYVQRAVAVADLELDLVIDDALPRLPPQVETLYFRIAQEAVTNTLRHAAATRLSVRLTLERGVLVLEVADD